MVRKIKEITAAEIALEFVEFVEIKGYLQDFIKNIGAVDKLDSAAILAGLIEEEIKRMPEPKELCNLNLFDVTYYGFSWMDTPEGPDFWCLMNRVWQDHVRHVLLPIYEELGLLGEEEEVE